MSSHATVTRGGAWPSWRWLSTCVPMGTSNESLILLCLCAWLLLYLLNSLYLDSWVFSLRPLWLYVRRINLLWYFIWKRLLSTCWLLRWGHCSPSFLFLQHPYSEEVITTSLGCTLPATMWLFRNGCLLFLTLPHGLLNKLTHTIKHILTQPIMSVCLKVTMEK